MSAADNLTFIGVDRHMRELARGILLGGLVAGTLDIGAASLIYHVGPTVILRSIASGLIGEAALHGGVSTVLLGLGLQWAMALLIAAFYCVAARRLRFLLSSPLLWGVVYGAGIFVVMNYVVTPLSAIAHLPRFTLTSFVLNLLAMLVFGLIVVCSASRSMAARKRDLRGTDFASAPRGVAGSDQG